MTVGQQGSMHTTGTPKPEQRNGVQPSFFLLFTPVLFPLRRVKNVFSEKGP